ncbi:hypothetical protein ACFQ36_15670 [Arthrobacter sp. GCM10027362]|uniref:hypothetical protein n=1 Tax=Arthrobacter sp. GCM10027362 TaxID=3273379 RepID=UPI003638FA73
MVQKLRVVVRVDLDGASVRIKVLGKVDRHTLIGLYSLIRRTNSLRPNLHLEVDLRDAHAEAAALAELHHSCKSGHLPEQVDPRLARCRLRVLDPASAAPAVRSLAGMSA